MRDGFDIDGGSLRSEGGDSANDSRGALRPFEVAPKKNGLDDSDVLGLLVGTLFEDRPLRMPGLIGLNVFRLEVLASAFMLEGGRGWDLLFGRLRLRHLLWLRV